MQTPDPATQPKLRGTIIVDGRSLFRLACPIAEDLIDPKARNHPETYLDLLPFLAENGYRIVIPEAVAIVAGSRLADGGSLQPFSISKSMLNNTCLESFVGRVSRKEFPNIAIVTATGPATADQYCATIHQIIKDYKTKRTIDPHFARDRQERIQASKLRAAERLIMAANRRFITSHLCEDATLSCVERLAPSSHAAPLFLLSDSVDLSRQVRSSGIKALSCRPFFHALVDAGLNEHAGLLAGVTGETLFRDALAHDHQAFEAANAATLSDAGTARFLTTTHNNPSQFLRTLQLLRRDRDAAAAQQPPEPSPETENPPTGASRFAQRFGSFGLRTAASGQRAP